MKIGLILHVDADDIPDVTRRYQEQLSLVEYAEAVGIDCVWLTEHHGQPDSPTPRPELFIAHALARTQRIAFGTAALLLGQRDALDIAEIIAMLWVLAPQRIKIGLAKGGPFLAHQNIWQANEIRAERLISSLPALHDWLEGKGVVLHDKRQPVYLTPYPQGLATVPLYLATRDPLAIAQAARWRMGLMAAQFWQQARVAESVQTYQRMAGHAPNLMLVRGIYVHEQIDIARARAFEQVQRVRARKAEAKQDNKTTDAPGPDSSKRGIDRITLDNIDEFVLVGPESLISERMAALAAIGVSDLALNPMTDHTDERRAQLEAIGRIARSFNAATGHVPAP